MFLNFIIYFPSLILNTWHLSYWSTLLFSLTLDIFCSAVNMPHLLRSPVSNHCQIHDQIFASLNKTKKIIITNLPLQTRSVMEGMLSLLYSTWPKLLPTDCKGLVVAVGHPQTGRADFSSRPKSRQQLLITFWLSLSWKGCFISPQLPFFRSFLFHCYAGKSNSCAVKLQTVSMEMINMFINPQ